MSGGDKWACPTCRCEATTVFCPSCGERVLDPRDLTVRGLVIQALEALSNLDGRLIRSFRCLVTRPGALTVAYLQGQRKQYLLPFPLFLVANLVFFGAQSLASTKIFSTPLNVHLHSQIWSGAAQEWVTHRLASRHTSLELYAPIFDQAVLVHAKSLIILMVLSFSPLLPIVLYRSRRPFVAHIVFSLHLYAFLLLVFCVALAVSQLDVKLGHTGVVSAAVDHGLSIFLLLVCAAYLFAAIKPAYGETGAARLVKSVVLTAGVALIIMAYRFVLLPITLYST